MSSVPKAFVEKMKTLAALIDTPESMLPYCGDDIYEDMLYIEYKDGQYHFLYQSRGSIVSDRIPDSEDEALYWVFRDITGLLAHADPSPNKEDPRRFRWQRQEDYMARLDAKWRDRLKEEHKEEVRQSPFDDLASVRDAYILELAENGVAERRAKTAHLSSDDFPVAESLIRNAAMEIAQEKYPYPKGEEK